ncbi:MAG: lipopolysaccharide transport periplasmic protein LptA [Hyphomicrobiaceae bacterium]|nr:lipopolysaccharide transport periplasmic protein LptA [Hyphomicrobiaceae bacterium]
MRRVSAGGLAALGAILLAAVFFPPASARAQTFADGLSGFTQNSDEPIEIESDELEVRDTEGVAVFRGSVVVRQGAAVMRTARLVVEYEGGGGTPGATAAGAEQRIRSLEASGGVVITSDDQTATGETASFDMAREVIVMSGDVVLTQGGNVVRGDRLTVNLATRESRIESPDRATGGGRVRGLFIPGQAPGQAN